MSYKLRYCVFILATFTGHVVSKITITSSPQLGVDTVCDNQDVTLMCHTDQITDNMITWYWFDQSQHGDAITVVARMTGLAYTCVVSDKDGQQLENSSIIVVANGAPPLVDGYNFNPYILIYEGSNLTLVTEISSDLPLSSGYPKWIIDGNLPLPSTAVVDNYTTDGVLYSRLSLYELSFEDDSGNYTNIVSNQCGTSSVSVYIDVRKAPIVCNNSGSVVVPQKNIMTVKGESVVLHCLFKGNLKILWPSMSSYWMIGPHDQHTEATYIMDNSTDPYRIAVYQTCLSEDGSCCNFTNQLNIVKVSLGLHNTVLTCGEVLDEVVNTHAASMMVFDFPTVVKTSDRNIKAHINDSKTLQCQFSASTVKDVTIVVWTKDEVAISSSDHYEIRAFTKPAIEDLIISELTVNNINATDKGRYTCYCYYNGELVVSSKPVVSEQRSFRLYFKTRNKFPFAYVAVGIATVLLFILGLASVLVVYIKYHHRWHKGTSAEKVHLMEEEQDTGGNGNYGINGVKNGVYVKEELNDPNRGAASANRSTKDGQMRPVLDHVSLNFNSSHATGPSCPVSQESDSEDDVDRQLLELKQSLLLSNPTACTSSASIHPNHTEGCQVSSIVCVTVHSILPHPMTVSHAPDKLDTQENDSDEIDDEIQSKHFSNDVLASMAKHWFDFGLKLGIDEIYLNNIMPTTTKKFFTNMLQKWWHRTDAVARTWNKVVSALDAVKLSGLAKRVYDRRIKQADNFVDDDM
ncbi:uncharacterized protein [Dysidea avara]|uniref:uncharacterized protein isoform X2 n=1 Tax=Dysidea avara TaxID=196820 RepID=UPI0033348E95